MSTPQDDDEYCWVDPSRGRTEDDLAAESDQRQASRDAYLQDLREQELRQG